MATEKDKQRAQDMKDGPNTIVEDAKNPKAVNRPRIPAAEKLIQDAKMKTRPSEELEPCSLQHYLSADFGPKREDQCAGFAYHAKSMGPRTIPEWRAEFAKFMAKPIK
jgi:hypothetical protein